MRLLLLLTTVFLISCNQQEEPDKAEKSKSDTLAYNPTELFKNEILPPLINKTEFDGVIYKQVHEKQEWKELIIDPFGNKREGVVYLTTKDFFGQNPYNVPFVAYVVGYISELYVNDKKVSFIEGKEIFFRQKINLENGYNRIPVKVITKSGKTFNQFIEITIESKN